jgi:hypothetical protein
VAQSGDAEWLERDGAAEALFLLLASDEEILEGLRTNPETTLWNHGFALSPREMEIVRGAIESTSKLTFEETLKELQRSRVRRWP